MSDSWASVIVAGIAAVSAVASAAITALVYLQIRTGDAPPIGQIASEIHETTTDTNAKVAEVVDVVKHQ